LSQYKVFPYFYPTTIFFVDDNSSFLENLSLQIDPGTAYQLFDSAGAALREINAVGRSLPLYRRCLSPYRDYPETAIIYPGQQAFILDLAKISGEIYNAQRFSEISVVVVDYDMPEMNGLELCAQIESPYIRKILLTGKADEKTAVEAFNKNVIDRFIMKSEVDAAEKINSMIAELQNDYFADVGESIIKCFAVSCPRFLTDEKFAAFFDGLRKEYGIEEYYFTTRPNGFIGLSVEGDVYLLIVMAEEDYQVHWEIVRDQDGPRDLMQLLEKREVVPYFWQSGGFFTEGAEDWRSHLLPASTFRGQVDYRYAVIKSPPSVKAGEGRILSYRKYLELLDAAEADMRHAPSL
tara:strand:+ start:1498 stop:2547 length:1050 start_codon:yes stop_codon:yes gene_type:complete